jgi:predicted dehydrogenase
MLERLLVVGLGSIGRRHVRLARELMPDVDITVLRRSVGEADPDLRVDQYVTTLEEALARRPQAAVIAGPSTMHRPVAQALAYAGTHLLIEKPLADRSEGVADLLDTARARDVVLMTGYNMRFLPTLRRLRDEALTGRIGRVLSVRAEVGQYLPSWRPAADYRTTVSAQAHLGGGVLPELSHEIDYLRWIFGDVSWVSAVLLRQGDLEIDVEDTAHLLLGFHSAERTEVVASVTLDFVRRDTVRGCTIVGERGSLRWNAIEGTVSVYEPDAPDWVVVFTHRAGRDDSYLAEWREFIDCISAGRSPAITGEDGLAVVQVIEAARESSAQERIIRIPPPTAVSHARGAGA